MGGKVKQYTGSISMKQYVQVVYQSSITEQVPKTVFILPSHSTYPRQCSKRLWDAPGNT